MDAAAEAGISTVTWAGGEIKDHLLESTGTGAAFFDFDRDGRLDVYLVNSWALDEEPSRVRIRGRNALYRNLGNGRFENVADLTGVGDDGWGCGVCAADYDDDGWVDLYVTNYGPNRLYRNLGGERFEDVTERAGVGDAGWGASCSFFDAEGDGDLDLYLANYVEGDLDDVLTARRSTTWQEKAKVMAGPFGMRGDRDRFWLNEGEGRFRLASEEAGLTDEAESYGLGVLASDLDLDGDVDIYVANDSNPNFLFQNLGDGTFEDIGGWCGAGYSADGAAQAGMGVDAADFDGDGRPDILVTNFARDHCTLYRNEGDLFFLDVTREWGLHRFTYENLSWGCAFFDPDLDADLDVVIVNGHIYPQVDHHPEIDETYRQRITLLRRDGDALEDVRGRAGPGLEQPISARGLAVGDYDDDGDPDLFVTGMDCAPLLLRNDSERRGHWLKVRLLSERGAPVPNARARVVTGDRTQLGEIRCGSTYQSQNSADLLFGLGVHDRVDTLEVQWPDGSVVVRTDVPGDRLTTLSAGES